MSAQPQAQEMIAQGRRIGEILLSVEEVSLSFGGVNALTDVSFDVREHEIRAIIGPNGAGKSSMLNVINGVYHPQKGTIRFLGQPRHDVDTHEAAAQGIARTFQNLALFKGMNVLDNIMTGRNLRMRAGLLAQAIRFGRAEREELEHRAVVERIIDFLEIQAYRKTPVGRLPYGLQKRVDLGRALAMEPRLLLLDEPMAGLGPEESARMVAMLRALKSELTILLVEHDMEAVFALADRITVLVYGRVIASGAPHVIRADEAVREAYLGEEEAEGGHG